MKWYKQPTNEYASILTFRLREKFGVEGCFIYSAVKQLVLERFEMPAGGSKTAMYTVELPALLVSEILRFRAVKIRKILDFVTTSLAKHSDYTVAYRDDVIIFNILCLREIADEWTNRKAAKHSGVAREAVGSKEVEVEEENTYPPNPPCQGGTIGLDAVASGKDLLAEPDQQVADPPVEVVQPDAQASQPVVPESPADPPFQEPKQRIRRGKPVPIPYEQTADYARHKEDSKRMVEAYSTNPLMAKAWLMGLEKPTQAMIDSYMQEMADKAMLGPACSPPPANISLQA